MFRLTVLEGKRKGENVDLTSFPFVLGKNVGADLRVLDAGVWDHHAAIKFEPGAGPQLRRLGAGTVSLNAKPIDQSKLRNGDVIVIGAAVFSFGSSPNRVRGLGWFNFFTWLMVAFVVFLELACIVFLIGSA
ncbi:MAG: hypothetical protein M2R45_02302 [Verrucomicrobia subdivision 3 bacterium]|nr:hypothetical protein [Limisphaerales bacterium]MCS1414681.1 hypothetical protein [Limisphaerales bacterium]